MNRRFLLCFGITCGLTALMHTASAQGPGSGGPVPGPVTPPDPTAVPIDGGASLLLAGGAAYALKRLRKRR
ncbi:PID-CTERM protein-sorting domain-containing protein [Hymenobacter sp. CRA2]|uniref:PID-CTERM protein-sorting domain-containing protein n=1 Tax=Hymenobacter sp. CRA2 TaxID=1955620 RepID=UPI00098EBB17|nr:hypothetical protein [Hymenobacter sp. CRA2]OON67777.1 hypothetical protein B0919_16415 [Hymenobacter sp. CRA2]